MFLQGASGHHCDRTSFYNIPLKFVNQIKTILLQVRILFPEEIDVQYAFRIAKVK